jgi:hypothetical protein
VLVGVGVVLTGGLLSVPVPPPPPPQAASVNAAARPVQIRRSDALKRAVWGVGDLIMVIIRKIRGKFAASSRQVRGEFDRKG